MRQSQSLEKIKKEKRRGVLSSYLRARGIYLNRERGQNLLHDPSMLKKIVSVARVGPGDAVVEIGAGIGNLTKVLAERAGSILAIEVDRGLVRLLEEELAHLENVKVIHADGLSFDYLALGKEMGKKLKLVANLPFSISTPILMHLIKHRDAFESMHLTFQKEVAERLVATPGTKSYSVLTVMVQMYLEPKIIVYIPRTCFFPRPKVDACLVGFRIRQEPLVGMSCPEIFEKVVKASFAQRRKVLANSLVSLSDFFASQRDVVAVCEAAGIDPRRRGETLTIKEFARLADSIHDAGRAPVDTARSPASE